MLVFPAIDIIKGQAVRLLKGDYAKMTIYSDKPEDVASDFVAQGATWVHLVDLEGAKSGKMPNLQTVINIKERTSLKVELGGGIRNLEAVDLCIDAGIDRVILGTAAVNDRQFLISALKKYKDRIAVGVDIRDGLVSINGWTQQSNLRFEDFCEDLVKFGVTNLIVTDISKDGTLKGINTCLYENLNNAFENLNITASGGVSSLEDIIALAKMKIYSAIVGKAYYTGDINLKEAIKAAKC